MILPEVVPMSARLAGVPEVVPQLSRGKHRNPRKGACFMELASYLAGEACGDEPAWEPPPALHPPDAGHAGPPGQRPPLRHRPPPPRPPGAPGHRPDGRRPPGRRRAGPAVGPGRTHEWGAPATT